MTRLKLILRLASGAILAVLLADVGSATVPRAFVSTTGSDTNPCSAVQPCRSFNQALTVVEAGGEIVVQDSGGYSTGFTITHSVTIDAAGFNASVISTSSADLCSINASATDRVILRGISFHGAGVGFDAINANVGSLYVEHCSFAEFAGGGVSMSGGGVLSVVDTDFRKCGDGVYFLSGSVNANLVVRDSSFAECSTGVFLEAAGPGAVTGFVTNCSATSGSIGFNVESVTTANADLTLTNCGVIGNFIGILASCNNTGNATARLAYCAVTNNSTGINKSALGAGTASVLGTNPGTNLISGNQSGSALGGTAVSLQ
jgi:hypothetical protein